jgi:hypothetical protein
MEKGTGFIALALSFVLILFAAQRFAGVDWKLGLVLLIGGALAAGFAGSVNKVSSSTTNAAGRGIGMVLRLLLGAFAIACMVTGGLWLLARMG